MNKETILIFSASLVALLPAFIGYVAGGFIIGIVVFFISCFFIKAIMRG